MIAPVGGVALVMAILLVLEVPAEVVTLMVAEVPGVTAHCPFVPLGVGTVNVIALSLQLSMVKVASSGGAPQLVPLSLNVR